MEFVALGILGIFAIANRPTKIPTTVAVIDPSIQNETNSIQSLEQAFKQDVENHMKQPNVVMPYFRSLKSQNTSDDVKDRRLGTFTGVNNIEYRPKVEMEAAVPVKDLTNIHGVTFQPDMERYQNYMVSGKNHNVSPVPKQYVGPGLGINPQTPAEGGFHSFFRILPDNVNGYRKNTFGGTVVHGHNTVAQRESDAFQDTRDLNTKLSPEEQARLGERGYEAKFGAVSGPQVRSSVHASEKSESCFPMSGANSSSTMGMYTTATPTRQDDRTQVNSHFGGSYLGINNGYQNNRYMHVETERETENCHTTNAHGSQLGTYTPFSTTAVPTMRGQANATQGTMHNGLAAPTARVGFNEARPTQKQQTLFEYTGNAGLNAGHTLADTQLHRNTMRGNPKGTEISGPAGSVIPGAANYDINAQVYGTRDQTNVTGYVPNQARNTTNSRTWGAVTQFSSDANGGRISSNPHGRGLDTHTGVHQLGATDLKCATVENTRDFGYVPTNPLRTSIV